MSASQELRSLANSFGIAWWAKIEAGETKATYWFGPFLTKRSLKINISDFLDDLENEGTQSIGYKLSRCRCIEPLTF